MASQTINMTYLATIANSPIVKLDNGKCYPLYARIKNDVNKFTEIELSPKYAKACELKLGSPTNIRRVFITYNDCYTFMYTGNKRLRNGKVESDPLWIDRSYSMTCGTSEIKVDRNRNTSAPTYGADLGSLGYIAVALENIVAYNQAHEDYIMAKSYDKTAKEPIKTGISGSGMGFAAYPYVMSNIEEIYFDWSLLISDENISYFGGNAVYQYAYNLLCGGIGMSAPFNSNNILQCFIDKCSGGSTNLRKRFPRLKVIAFVPNLYNIMRNADKGKGNPAGYGIDRSSNKLTSNPWVLAAADLIKQTGNMPVICDLRHDATDDFVLKPNVFIFDRDYLDKWYKDTTGNKAKEAVTEEVVKESPKEKEAEPEGEIEKLLHMIVKNTGCSKEKLVRLIMSASRGLTGAELEAAFNSATTNERKYLSCINKKGGSR